MYTAFILEDTPATKFYPLYDFLPSKSLFFVNNSVFPPSANDFAVVPNYDF